VVRGNYATNELAAETAGGLGGGIYYAGYGGAATVQRCVIDTNRAYRGGAAFVDGVTLQAEDTIVNGNRVGAGSQSFGGGFFCDGGLIRNCLMYDNNSWAGRGSAVNMEVYGSNVVLTIENCTIVGNTNGGYGVSLRAVGAAQGWTPSLHLINTLIYSNALDLSVGVGGEGPPDNFSTYASNCCFGSTNIMYGPTNLLYFKGLSANTFTNNPRFMNYAARNYRPAFNSPCINAGLNQGWMTGAVDFDGNPRISPMNTGTVDIGAYEYPIQIGSVFNLR
jgi:hypothetical protein